MFFKAFELNERVKVSEELFPVWNGATGTIAIIDKSYFTNNQYTSCIGHGYQVKFDDEKLEKDIGVRWAIGELVRIQ